MDLPPKDWALTGAQGRKPNRLKSLYLQDGELSEHNWKLYQKYERMKKEEVRFESFLYRGCQIDCCRLRKHGQGFKNLCRIGERGRDEGGTFQAHHALPLSRKRPFMISLSGLNYF